MPAPTRKRARHARPRPRRRAASRWRLRIATVLSALVLSAGGAGHTVVTTLDTAMTRVDPFRGLSARPQDSGKGLNFLLVGTDGRDTVSAAERRAYSLGGAPCNCTDTIMLVHFSADRSRASVVSLPRDSYVELPAHTDRATGRHHAAGRAKLNAAYAHGGPQLTVRTVEHATGVRVDHYLEVDFASFMRTVDAIGGVPVCTPRPLRDSYSGLDLPAGTTRLDGGRALQYVRARHIDGTSDLGRIQRQQRFLASVIDEATDRGVLMSPTKLREVVSALLGSVRADPGFGADEMLALGRAMRGLTASSSEFASVPVADPSHHVPGVGSTVLWDEAGARQLFRALREDRPLTGPGGRPRHDRTGRAEQDARPGGDGRYGREGQASGAGGGAGEASREPRQDGDGFSAVTGDTMVCS